MATKLLKEINPQAITNQNEAMNALNKLKSYGLPPNIIDKVNQYTNHPIANMAFGSLGINKQNFTNGLQAIMKPDITSASRSTSLLQGIDQLK